MSGGALVVGASGYIGSHLLKSLGDMGWEAHGTYFRNHILGGGKLCFLDARDFPSVLALLRNARPRVIFHLAYDMADMEGSIVGSTENLLRARREACPESRFIYISTDMVFDGNNAPYSEWDAALPITEYGRCKLEAEKMVLSQEGHVMRTSLVYGFDPMDSRTSLLLQGLRTGEFPYPYFQDEIRSPIWVLDLCRALVNGAQSNILPPLLHVAGPDSMSRYEMACLIAEAFGHSSSHIPFGSLMESPLLRPKDLRLNISLARRVLHFEPRSLRDVLCAMGSLRDPK